MQINQKTLNLLDGQAKGSWDDWRNVALCMKFTTTFEHFEKFSKINIDKYDIPLEVANK